MTDLRASQNQIARWVKRHPKTVKSWFDEETPVDIEAVLAAQQLAGRFRRAFCTHDHDELEGVHDGAPYIARKRKRARGKQ